MGIDGADPISRPVGIWHRECANGALFSSVSRVDGSAANRSPAGHQGSIQHKKRARGWLRCETLRGNHQNFNAHKKAENTNRWLNFPETISGCGQLASCRCRCLENCKFVGDVPNSIVSSGTCNPFWGLHHLLLQFEVWLGLRVFRRKCSVYSRVLGWL